MRVLITGMAGELGSRVAQLLEEDPAGHEVLGLDFVPPRRRLRRSSFRRIDPNRRDAVAAHVEEVAPEVVLHLGVYEPHARSSPRGAVQRTTTGTIAVLGAAARAGALRRVVVRSGIEVYGRGRSHATVPDEDVMPAPGSTFGRLCLEAEAVAASLGRRLDVPVAALRLAPVLAAHHASPLGRLLRLPVVPLSAHGDPAFCVLHLEDAARAVAAAATADAAGPVNVVASGAATPWQAVRLGGRLAFPVPAPLWRLARQGAEVAGAPVPDHVEELLRRGRAADGGRAADALGVAPELDAQEVLADLFEWASVTPLRQAAVA